jgi:uncharacterized protein with PQ loop repeat
MVFYAFRLLPLWYIIDAEWLVMCAPYIALGIASYMFLKKASSIAPKNKNEVALIFLIVTVMCIGGFITQNILSNHYPLIFGNVVMAIGVIVSYVHIRYDYHLKKEEATFDFDELIDGYNLDDSKSKRKLL